MFRVAAVALALVFAASQTLAQEVNKQFIVSQPCDPVQKMTGMIIFKYNEMPLFSARGKQLSAQTGEWYESEMMYFVNQEIGTWSLVSLYPDGTGCLVASGTRFEPYVGRVDLADR